MNRDLLTSSRIKTFHRCPREHQYRYERKLLPNTDPDTIYVGRLVRQGLAAWWRSAPEDRLAAALAAVAAHAPPDRSPYDRVRVEEMLRGYHAAWRNEPYQPLAVAAEFCTLLRNPATGGVSPIWMHAGRLDVVAVDPSGRIVLLKHKTTVEDITPGSAYWTRLRLDAQVAGYLRGAERLGYAVVTCLYDVLGRPRLRPLAATPPESRRWTLDGRLDARQRLRDETPEEFRQRLQDEIGDKLGRYYQRADVHRDPAALAEYDLELWQQGRLIHESRLMQRAPRNPDACRRFDSLCPYFDLCTNVEQPEGNPRFRRVDWPHRELAPPRESLPLKGPSNRNFE